MDNHTETVRGLAEKLAGEANSLTKTVTDFEQYNTSLDLFMSPLRVLVNKNGAQPSALDSLCATRDAAESRQEGAGSAVVTVAELVGDLVQLLDPGSLVFDVSKGDGFAESIGHIKPLAGIMFEVDENALTAAGLAVQAWEVAKTKLASASTVTTRDVPSHVGTRGPGALVEEHGFKVAFTCDHCKTTYTGGSNLGSIQDQLANHYAKCMKVERPRKGTAIHKGFTDALNVVVKRESPRDIVTQGGGFVLARQYV